MTVSRNVKRLVREWEAAGAIGGSRLATRKEAIRRAVALALREAGRGPRAGPDVEAQARAR